MIHLQPTQHISIVSCPIPFLLTQSTARCCNFGLLITSVLGLDGCCCLHVCRHIASCRVLPTMLLRWPLLLGSWQSRCFAICFSGSASCYAAVRLRSAVAVLASCGRYWTRSCGLCCFLDWWYNSLHAKSACQCSVHKAYFPACCLTSRHCRVCV